MSPPLLKLIREALAEARSDLATHRGITNPDLRHLARDAALCVTHLEDALLRAMLLYSVNGLKLPQEAGRP